MPRQSEPVDKLSKPQFELIFQTDEEQEKKTRNEQILITFKIAVEHDAKDEQQKHDVLVTIK